MTKKSLTYNEVKGIVKSIMKYKDNDSLKLINNKVRKVIFNKNTTLSKDEKITIVNQEAGKMRVTKTKKKIHDAIIQWDKPEKITALKISKQSGVSISTVNRYWSDFKTLVGD